MSSEPDPKDEGEQRSQAKLDDELIELLNELRVALPGVTVLFAFLLTVPFASGFSKLSSLDRTVYFSAFMCTAISSVFLMAPTAQHRVRWRKGEKDILLRISNRLAIAGLILLAAAIGQVVFVVADVLFGLGAAIAVSAVIVVLLVVFWFAIPLTRTVDKDKP